MSQTSQAKARRSSPKSNPAPRKRRKRTVVSGAAEDCFTCARSGSQCDRRRPYCTHCLENGLECAGYKTTLTWGVGVASRGKFRGLSLPVTGAQPAGGDLRHHHAAKIQEVSQCGPSPTSTVPASLSDLQPQLPSPTSDSTYENPPHRRVLSTPGQPWAYWNQPGIHQPIPISHPQHPPLLYPGTDSSTDIESPPPGSSWLAEVWMSTRSPASGECPAHTQAVWEGDQTVEDLDGRRNSHSSLMSTSQSPSLSQLLLARSVGQTPRLRYLISYYAEVIAPVIVAFDSPTNPFRTSILRLAQDSTSLQEAIATLSTSNLRQRRERGVISTGRTEPARMSSLAHRALTGTALQEWYDPSVLEGFTREEQYHRGKAVQELNKELADPQKRLSDSVLATLLILCLFHVCDTGVAQFKTQFAGVTKLLAIRMRNSPCLSDELKWFIRMFTWYDTMTATTNDREIQLHTTCVDLAAVSDSEWGLENLVGCDAGLFRLIAHLGRLNLLSRNQEANTAVPSNIFIPTTTPPPSMVYCTPNLFPPGIPAAIDPSGFPPPTLPRPSGQAQQPLSPAFWAEWYSIRQQLEAWRLPRDLPGSVFPTPSRVPYGRTMMDAYMSPPSSPLARCGVAPENVKDVLHISESFRHSAILYSERLAYPEVPSHHPRIQQIVQRSMAHILAVKSDVYLLWPLFITGSECVLEEHCLIIQERCKDISTDSGFINNLSCLELLQKIWAENPSSTPGVNENSSSGYIGTAQDGGLLASPLGWSASDAVVPDGASSRGSACVVKSQGFRWYQVMQAKRAQGEYMVV
ncbi:hypothetical protein ARAM_004677 [Aspergillus rambellii]|uniref:Zn(2)-C6 fungal-type domain-containing protein n=1 Tax=Aspergillus rambellii TaxID=308745 RepID=A0A0F8U707_9EURO|nr:hypothetical protein ARAM_004677 [Aspergillus rambellii]